MAKPLRTREWTRSVVRACAWCVHVCGVCMCVVCATHTMEYHPTFKEETLPLATTQMSLESTMLSEFARRTANACRIPPRRTR